MEQFKYATNHHVLALKYQRMLKYKRKNYTMKKNTYRNIPRISNHIFCTWQFFWKSELLHLNNNIFSQYKQSKHCMPTLLTENLKQYRSWYWYLSTWTNLSNIRMHIMHHQKADWLDGSAVVGLDGGLVAAVVGLYGGLAVRPGGWFLTCFTRSRCQLQ